MSDDISTDPDARPMPAWVYDLPDEYLLPAERDLIAAARLLVRARHGRTRLPEPKRVARLFITDALAALDREAGR